MWTGGPARAGASSVSCKAWRRRCPERARRPTGPRYAPAGPPAPPLQAGSGSARPQRWVRRPRGRSAPALPAGSPDHDSTPPLDRILDLSHVASPVIIAPQWPMTPTLPHSLLEALDRCRCQVFAAVALGVRSLARRGKSCLRAAVLRYLSRKTKQLDPGIHRLPELEKRLAGVWGRRFCDVDRQILLDDQRGRDPS
jgi:hypothetical protein